MAPLYHSLRHFPRKNPNISLENALDSHLRVEPGRQAKKQIPVWVSAFLAYTTQFDTMQRKGALCCIR